MIVQFLWFTECANHAAARELLLDVLKEKGIAYELDDIEATDPRIAAEHRFPGSPTIRIDGRDIEPEYQDSGDHTPRCRLYYTSEGLSGIPERRWIVEAIERELRQKPG